MVQHAFDNYGAQRNWAIDNLVLRYPWQLHLDADERLTPELIASIQSLPENPAQNGFLIARLVEFLGRTMRHGGMSPTWHLRLFRNGEGRCEERKYDQHFYLTQGSAGQLQGVMIDEIRMSLSEWTARHNRWSDAEVMEQTTATNTVHIQPRFWGIRWSASAFSAASTTAHRSSCVPMLSSSTAIFFAWVFSTDGKVLSSGPCKHSGSDS